MEVDAGQEGAMAVGIVLLYISSTNDEAVGSVLVDS